MLFGSEQFYFAQYVRSFDVQLDTAWSEINNLKYRIPKRRLNITRVKLATRQLSNSLSASPLITPATFTILASSLTSWTVSLFHQFNTLIH